MTALASVDFDLPPGGPTVSLLDATRGGWDEPALRERARVMAERHDAPHSSRSYRFPYALLAWHIAPVGVDIERIEPLDPAFVSSISMPGELSQPASADPEHAASLWSSKEALAKALGDAVDYDPRRLESPIFWPGGTSGRWRALRLPVPHGHVGWVCWRADT